HGASPCPTMVDEPQAVPRRRGLRHRLFRRPGLRRAPEAARQHRRRAPKARTNSGATRSWAFAFPGLSGPGSHELGHRGVALLRNAFAPEHLHNGEPEDLEVQPEAPVVHVPDVLPEPLLPCRVVSAIHLRPARDARPHLVPPGLLRRITIEVLGK